MTGEMSKALLELNSVFYAIEVTVLKFVQTHTRIPYGIFLVYLDTDDKREKERVKVFP